MHASRTGQVVYSIDWRGDAHACFGMQCRHVRLGLENQYVCGVSGRVVGVEHTGDPDRAGRGVRERAPIRTTRRHARGRLDEAARHVRRERGRLQDGGPALGRGDPAHGSGGHGNRSRRAGREAGRCALTRFRTQTRCPRRRAAQGKLVARGDRQARQGGDRGHRQAVHRHAQGAAAQRVTARPAPAKPGVCQGGGDPQVREAVRRWRERAQPRRAEQRRRARQRVRARAARGRSRVARRRSRSSASAPTAHRRRLLGADPQPVSR